MAKYKDYPVYTYDEPATYSDFSGGINTDPSNEHLQPNEMRDCLNMHYSSAALVKRKGASLLCNIECEEELFNIQGVFLFTYRVTYIIVAADGKLYEGFYSPKAKIRLSRLPITVDMPDSFDAYNPIDITVGLDKHITENINQKHEGFIYSYMVDNGKKLMLDSPLYEMDTEGKLILDQNNQPIIKGETFLGDYKLLDNCNILANQIIQYDNVYYKLKWNNPKTPLENKYITKSLITPETVHYKYVESTKGNYVLHNGTYVEYSEEFGNAQRYSKVEIKYWITLSEYNSTYKEDIINRTDPLSVNAEFITNALAGLVLDTKTNEWKQAGQYIGETWVSNGAPGNWTERYQTWEFSSSVTYKGKIYICIIQHSTHVNPPNNQYASPDAEWVKLNEKKELIFQNHDNIEAATYNNKLYITTGTRFIVVELLSNKLVAHTVMPYMCNTSEIINIGYNYLSPYPELCRSTQYNQAITSIGGLLVNKSIYGRYTLTPQMTFAQGETEHDYYFKWEKKVGDEWLTVYSYKDNELSTSVVNYKKDPKGDFIQKDGIFIPIDSSFLGWELFSKDPSWPNSLSEYISDPLGDYVRLYNSIDNKFDYYALAFIVKTQEELPSDVERYSRIITGTTTSKVNKFTIEVDDADKYQYRVSFAKSFEQPSEIVQEWDYYTTYHKGDKVSVKNTLGTTEIFVCIKDHCPSKTLWDNCEYLKTEYTPSSMLPNYYYQEYEKDSLGNYATTTKTPIFSTSTSTKTGKSIWKKEDNVFKLVNHDTSSLIPGAVYWEKEYTEEAILTESGVKYDWIVNKIDGEYFGQSSSSIATSIEPEETFQIIQSCKKITSDGNKFLLYDDKYNSGSWYKTIINNPAYITHRGGLSFKTNKNESLIKVIPFNGVLIAFANAENVGGSIHMVTGNGDDWDDKSGYYSPYRRTTINVNVSCNNAATVQVCENILVFKYFDTLYYISGSELNNEVVSVYSCNDKIKHNNSFVRIPWEDNNCISEVTEDYYALLWKESYAIENDELVLDRPALKIKMYYKLGIQDKEKITYPWLRDESDFFNTDHIIYIKGKPVYLYNSTLTTFHEDSYTDFDTIYPCLVHFRGEDLNYPKMYKLISNVLVYYHRSQYSKIDFDLIVRNEAGHTLLDNMSKRNSIQDLRALRSGDAVIDGDIRLDSTILDSKVFNTSYKFPCLLADTIILSNNDKEFSISSITYNYITSETPETTSYDLYTSILRPIETKYTLKSLLNVGVLNTKVSSGTKIGKAIKGIRVGTSTLEGDELQITSDLALTIDNKTEFLPVDLFAYNAQEESLNLTAMTKENENEQGSK